MIDTNYKQLFEYLFIIFTILIGNSIYFCYNKLFISVVWQLLLIIICFYSILNTNDSKIYFFVLIYIILSFILLSAYYLYFQFSISLFILFAIDPALIFIYLFNDFRHNMAISYSLLYKFENVMLILSVISLFLYFLYSIGINPSSGVTYFWGGKYHISSDYIGFFFPNISSTNRIFGLTVPGRMTSIFAEAPVYSYLLSIALYINIFLGKDNKILNKESFVLLFCILLTSSTTGIILALLSIAYAKFIACKNIIKRILIFLLTPIIFSIVRIIFYNKKNEYIYYNSVNTSYYVRHEDILASIHAWGNNIIFGNGITNDGAIDKYINPLRFLPGGDSGITTSFFAVLAYGGIILALFYIIPTILSIKVSVSLFNLAIFGFIYFMLEGVMSYRIYIIILSFIVASFVYRNCLNKRTSS